MAVSHDWQTVFPSATAKQNPGDMRKRRGLIVASLTTFSRSSTTI
jgi:hypothetical protein